MREKPKLDLGLTAYDDLFKDGKELAESRLPKIYDIPIELIDDFPDHPFKVRMDEDMDQLVESIKERGLITPITLRPKEDGRYEVVSGHRRKKACEIAGLSYVKADVREMSRDEAIILMVESNLQRSVILPSEKAFSYKMRYEAMKRQGKRTDLTCAPVAHKLDGVKSRDVLAGEVGEGRDQIRRYIRLTELIPDLLDLVDEGKIALRPAVELSYLSKDEQSMVYKQIEICECTPSHAQTIRMRKISENGGLNSAMIEDIMLEEKPNQREKVSVSYDKVRKFIPESVPFEETGNYIMDALEFYQKYRSKVSQLNNKIKPR
ncbi:MAG: ParB/RepB/Spo0J family partition protein [Clostridiales bacterium]|nr:ParB/RepB/Spo0J family partition protein [Clostridiales bacterium]